MAPKKVQATLTNMLGKKTGRTAAEAVNLDDEVTAATVTKKTRAEAAPTTTTTPITTSSGGVDLLSLITNPEWKAALAPTIHGPIGQKIAAFLASEYNAGKEIFPPKDEIFAAINVLPLKDVKVVLIGQDPYHDNNQAHGLCFSVKAGIKPPPSLVNMYKELTTDISGFKTPPHGYLMKWAKKEGILMLNAGLTVEAHKANSHAKCGWLELTDEIIKIINKERENVVFLLWGGFAQKKGKIVDTKKHTAISVAHPSPLSVKHWVGCKTFSKCNEALASLGKAPVDWNLPMTPTDE